MGLVTLWDIVNKIGPYGRSVALAINSMHSGEEWLKSKRKSEGGDAQLSEDDLKRIKRCATLQESFAKELWMEHSILASVQLWSDADYPCNVADMQNKLRALREVVLRDLFKPMFLPATEDMVAYHGLKSPFGPSVAVAFPTCSEDIEEAHECFAFGRYTASMFHLGRAMEIAVAATAKRLRLNVGRKDWQNYLNAMNERVAKMPFKTPAQKARRLPIAEATGHFFNFKEAWRNPTFHAKKTYTREEALSVLKNSGAFMDYVARKIFKVKVS